MILQYLPRANISQTPTEHLAPYRLWAGDGDFTRWLLRFLLILKLHDSGDKTALRMRKKLFSSISGSRRRNRPDAICRIKACGCLYDQEGQAGSLCDSGHSRCRGLRTQSTGTVSARTGCGRAGSRRRRREAGGTRGAGACPKVHRTGRERTAGSGRSGRSGFSGFEFSQHHSFVCSGRHPTQTTRETGRGCGRREELKNKTATGQTDTDNLRESCHDLNGRNGNKTEYLAHRKFLNLPIPEPILQITRFWK